MAEAAPAVRHGRRSARGVTLIEMVVIVIVIAVVSSAAVPAYSRLVQRVQFRQTVQRVADLLGAARREAVDRGGDVLIQIDAQNDELSAQPSPPPDDADLPVELSEQAARAPVPAPHRLRLPEDVRIADVRTAGIVDGADAGQGSDVLLTFRDDGSCEGALLLLESRHGYAAQVEVAAAHGRVVVLEDGDGADGA